MSVLMTAFKASESDEGINPHRDWLLNAERKIHMLSLCVLDTSGEIFFQRWLWSLWLMTSWVSKQKVESRASGATVTSTN